MAIKGLSKLVIAGGYQSDDATNKISYDSVAVTEKMVEYEATPSYAEDDGLYGDNALAETAPSNFTDGDIKVTTTELTQDTSQLLYQIKKITKTIGDKSMTQMVYDRSTKSNTVGVGLIEEHQHKNKDFYRGIILPKVNFNINSSSASTRAGKIDWQTPQIEGKFMESDLIEAPTSDTVDDGLDRPYKVTVEAPTEAECLDMIKAWFNQYVKTGV